MSFHCPTCGEKVDHQPTWLIGQAMCTICNTVVNLTNAIDEYSANDIRKEYFEELTHKIDTEEGGFPI